LIKDPFRDPYILFQLLLCLRLGYGDLVLALLDFVQIVSPLLKLRERRCYTSKALLRLAYD
jgi:hypothetical protein